jgi:hypothetical protein
VSADTQKNAHYLFCTANEQRRNYAACVYLVKRIEDGALDELKDDATSCYNHVKKGRCNAVKMREREIEAGHALFFTPKRQIEIQQPSDANKSSEGYTRGWNNAGRHVDNSKSEDIKVIPQESVEIKPSKPEIDEFGNTDLSETVSKMAKVERLKKLKELKKQQKGDA